MCSRIIEMEFLKVTIAMDDCNEAIKSKNSQVKKNKNVKKIKAVNTDTEFTVFKKLQSLYDFEKDLKTRSIL